MKKYLGLIYILYSIIIIYTVFTDHLKNYLSPQLQIYIKIAIIPLLIIGLVIIFNQKVEYHFKISDLILLLPLIIFIISGDGRLTLNLAENRSSNLFTEHLNNQSNNKEEPLPVEEQPIVIEENTYDFSNPYFVVNDKNYDGLANYITFGEKANTYIGKTIKVKGFTIKYASYLPDGMFALGKYIISCCAADSSFGGFYVKYDLDKVYHNRWYEIEGVLEQGTDKSGNKMMYIHAINVKELDASKEDQYVYPCYSYDDGLCEEVTKYNLEY